MKLEDMFHVIAEDESDVGLAYNNYGEMVYF